MSVARTLVQQFDRMVRPDGGSVELVAAESGVLRVRYRPGAAREECASGTCALPGEELREQLFSRGSGYLLYKIVDTNVDSSFPMLRKMGNKLDRLEDDIFEGRSSEIVRDISNAGTR